MSDFGPIAEGSVELRPLTVFVGPSNTGKTYLATLVYSLHRKLSGFTLPFEDERLHGFRYNLPQIKKELSKPDQDQILKFLHLLTERESDIKWSNLPNVLARSLNEFLTSGNLGLEEELSRCFDLTELKQLIGASSKSHRAKISLDVQVNDENSWETEICISPEKISTVTNIHDFTLLHSGQTDSHFFGRSFWPIRTSDEQDGLEPELITSQQASILLEEFLFSIWQSNRQIRKPSIHYLPAARSGIMQSHRVIASSLVSRSTRAGVERFKEIPTFSGPLADFMERLLLFKHSDKPNKKLQRIAGSLERETLAGKITGLSTIPGAYPEFVYRPTNADSHIRLSRASSMVSELAPIVLFLRGVIGQNSTVIIEEPEAHLHPAAQAQIAFTLARMVRAGLRVVITTHSDWLLKSISNLIREGLLVADGSSTKASQRVFLRQSEVGVWLFRDRETGSSVEEIGFDTSEGLEPQEYEEVEEELYNQAANLQNQIAEGESDDT